MAVVTDLQYFLDDYIIRKLEHMIARCTHPKLKKDALLINEGAEGEGKSNSSIAEAYYIKHKTGRPIHLFFRLAPLIDFAKSTEEKIIIWDEPSLDSLKKDHFAKINRDLSRLMQTCRKKRHFFIFNFTKFYKFDEYIVVDRALGLIHMYSRKGIEPGRFVYVKQRELEELYRGYLSKHQRFYKQLSKYHGKFIEVMNKHFDKMGITIEEIQNATLQDYEKKKDDAILSIGTEIGMSKSELMYKKKYDILRKKIAVLPEKYNMVKREFAGELEIDRSNMHDWRSIKAEEPNSVPNTPVY